MSGSASWRTPPSCSTTSPRTGARRPPGSEDLDIPRPSVYRLVQALLELGLIGEVQGEGGSRAVRLGSVWLSLADASAAAIAEHAGSQAALDALARATGHTAYVSVPRGASVVCLDWREGPDVSLLALRPGLALPVYAGAAGRAYFAYAPAGSQPGEDALADPFPAFTGRTLRTWAELRTDAEKVRARGYAISDEDVTPGIAALGLPVWSGTTLRAIVSVGGPRGAVLDSEDLSVRALTEAARQIAAALAARS